MALTRVLARAVPEVFVERAEITYAPLAKAYFIIVHPSHVKYWLRFHKKYPHYKRIALRYGVSEHNISGCCPEFFNKADLVNWLVDVLSLSRGERKLLRLCMRT
ncbi:hypothetical protein DRO41_00910 [Candidatus Bathyarchaeota archaeon]|nr:MAG: hypothetical protein DRO41_00910 [Candidatus Bathyarchaeota archaeon]